MSVDTGHVISRYIEYSKVLHKQIRSRYRWTLELQVDKATFHVHYIFRLQLVRILIFVASMSSVALALTLTTSRSEADAGNVCIARSSFRGRSLRCTPLAHAPLHPAFSKNRRAAHTPATRASTRAENSITPDDQPSAGATTRRGFAVNSALMAVAGLSAGSGLVNAPVAQALPGFKKELKKREKIPEEAYTTLPSGLKYYDVSIGTGAGPVERGQRITVHYDAKWKNITFVTSRQGAGVTGGTPFGFDVGSSEFGKVLKGLDLGVIGMRVGGQRKLMIPPELAYGTSGSGGEIPPNATIDIDVELLSIKQDSRGYQVKLVEG
eukprot:jgi/Mesvir1/5167/Mv15305-RA.1